MSNQTEEKIEKPTEERQVPQPQQQGITQDQLFQQFTKSSQVVTNSFQLLFDGAMQLKGQNQIYAKILKDNNIPNPFEQPPMPKMPNRAERRAMEKIQKKQAKK